MNNPDWNLIAFFGFVIAIFLIGAWAINRSSDNTHKDLKNALDALQALQDKELKNGQNKNHD